MNKIALSPNSLVGVPALEYIDAVVKAGYDGIGLRMYASPGVNYESVTVPIVGLTSPEIARSVVVLPAPFGPTTATASPRSTRRLTSQWAVNWP